MTVKASCSHCRRFSGECGSLNPATPLRGSGGGGAHSALGCLQEERNERGKHYKAIKAGLEKRPAENVQEHLVKYVDCFIPEVL